MTSGVGLSRPAGLESLDDPPLGALDDFYLESDAREVIERLAQQVISLEAHGERLEQSLTDTNCPHRAADVLEHQQLAARTQDTERFSSGTPGVGNRAEAQRAGDGVEARVREPELLGVTDPEVGLSRELRCAALADRQHLRAQLNSRQLDVRRIEAQVPGRAARELKHLAASLGADPLPAAREQDPFKEADLAVVAGRLLVQDPADAFGLGSGIYWIAAMRFCAGRTI